MSNMRTVAALMESRNRRGPTGQKHEALEALYDECPHDGGHSKDDHKWLKWVHIRIPGRGRTGAVECVSATRLEETMHYWRLEANRRHAAKLKKYPKRKNQTLHHVAKTVKQVAWEDARKRR